MRTRITELVVKAAAVAGLAAGLAVIVGMLQLGIGAAGVAANESEPLPLTLAERTARSEQTMMDYQNALDQGRSVASFFAPDAVLIFAGSEEQIQGRDAIAAAFDHLLHGAFAGRLLLVNRVVIGESAAEIGDFVGTQIGTFHGTEATGNRVRVPYMVVYELTDGQITTMRFDLPTWEILRQLAAPQAPEETTPGQPGQPF